MAGINQLKRRINKLEAELHEAKADLRRRHQSTREAIVAELQDAVRDHAWKRSMRASTQLRAFDRGAS